MSVTDDNFGTYRRNGVQRPPPPTSRGAADWARRNLFSSPLNAALTLGCLILVIWAAPPLIRFFLLDAVWSGTDRDVCIKSAASGAGWAFVRAWFSYFTYVFDPVSERWRVDVFFAALALGLAWLGCRRSPRRSLGAIYFLVVLPLL